MYLDTKELKHLTVKHYNAQPPWPGLDAQANSFYASTLSGKMIIQKLFDENPDTLTNIEENGYAIINSGPLMSRLSQEKMSTYIKAKSG